MARKLLIKNFLSLSVLQFFNFIFPLVTVPYLLRTLGVSSFGVIAFSQSLIAYFAIIIDFGFNLSATGAIATSQNIISRTRLFWKTIIAKLFLLFSSLVGLLIIINFEPFKGQSQLLFLAFVVLIGNCLFPTWYFQGRQKMTYIPAIQVPLRLISTILIIILVKDQADINLAVAIPAFGYALTGVIGFLFGLNDIRFKIIVPKAKEVVGHLRDSWSLFVGQVATTFFNEFIVIILSIFSGFSAVGVYASADKIVNAITSMIAPISWAIYPHSSQLFTRSNKMALEFLGKVYRSGLVLFSLLAVMLLIFAPQIVLLISGTRNSSIEVVIRIISLVPLAIFMNNIFGTQILVSAGYKKLFMRSLIIAAIFSFTISLLLIPPFGAVGAGVVSLATEVLVTVTMGYYCHKNNLKLKVKNG